VEATEAYRTELDEIGYFIEERCEIDPGHWVETSLIYGAYSNWAQSNGYFPILTGTALGRRLNKKHYQQTKVKGHRGWQGLRPKTTWGDTAIGVPPRALPAAIQALVVGNGAR